MDILTEIRPFCRRIFCLGRINFSYDILFCFLKQDNNSTASTVTISQGLEWQTNGKSSTNNSATTNTTKTMHVQHSESVSNGGSAVQVIASDMSTCLLERGGKEDSVKSCFGKGRNENETVTGMVASEGSPDYKAGNEDERFSPLSEDDSDDDDLIDYHISDLSPKKSNVCVTAAQSDITDADSVSAKEMVQDTTEGTHKSTVEQTAKNKTMNGMVVKRKPSKLNGFAKKSSAKSTKEKTSIINDTSFRNGCKISSNKNKVKPLKHTTGATVNSNSGKIHFRRTSDEANDDDNQRSPKLKDSWSNTFDSSHLPVKSSNEALKITAEANDETVLIGCLVSGISRQTVKTSGVLMTSSDSKETWTATKGASASTIIISRNPSSSSAESKDDQQKMDFPDATLPSDGPDGLSSEEVSETGVRLFNHSVSSTCHLLITLVFKLSRKVHCLLVRSSLASTFQFIGHLQRQYAHSF